MLSKPDCGWTEITIGNFSDRASYLVDIPIELLEALIQSYQSNKLTTININAAGWEYKIIIDNYKTHIILEDENEYKLQTIDIQKNDLVLELIIDIEKNFEDWVYWKYYINSTEANKRRKKLNRLCNELKEKINN